MPSKSIVVIAHDCKEGGSVGSVALHQIIELSKLFKVYVITKDMPYMEYNSIHPILLSPKSWDFLKRFCHLPNELSFQRAARNALKALCNKIEISAVWCHSHGTVMLTALPLKKRYGFSIVMTTHGDIFDRPKGSYSQLLTSYYKWATPKAYKYSDSIQALSPYMAEWAIRNGAEAGKVRVIPNGIDPEDIGGLRPGRRSKDSFLRDGILRILFVGNLLPMKGVACLIHALSELKALKYPARVLCIGDGPEREGLVELSKRLCLEKDIEFFGKIPRRQLNEFYRQADLLCVPSVSDPLPTVVLEAFYMGLPVAGANTGGIPYLLNDGQRGFLFEKGNAKSLVDALVCAGKSRERLAEIGEKCIVAAETEFSWRLIGNELRELIGSETGGVNK